MPEINILYLISYILYLTMLYMDEISAYIANACSLKRIKTFDNLLFKPGPRYTQSFKDIPL